jgi:hypothetical protein
MSAKYRRQTGSELLIIEPEYVEWDSTQELYPFIFESVGDWEVTTSVSPPEGFISNQNSLSADVNSETEAVQFTITDIGSKWTKTGVTHKIKHKGKTKTIKSTIGIKCAKQLAKEKISSYRGGHNKYVKHYENFSADLCLLEDVNHKCLC